MAEQTMRERIARALFEHWVEEDFGHEYCSWELLPDKATWLDRADAVLDALREPTETMIEAAVGAWHDRPVQFLDDDMKSTWRAMIDSIKGEESDG